MQTVIPQQFKSEAVFEGPGPFRKLTVFFTPLVRAGCDPELDWSYVNFLFEARGGQPNQEFSFMPRNRWTSDHYNQWEKVLTMVPDGFNIETSFEQATIDLVL